MSTLFTDENNYSYSYSYSSSSKQERVYAIESWGRKFGMQQPSK